MVAHDLLKFFGWCGVINFLLLLLCAAVILSFRGPLSRLHARMFGVPEETVLKLYVQFLVMLELCWLFFNIVPYFAMRIIT